MEAPAKELLIYYFKNLEMRKILFLSFYYEPDLSAGSFRNTSLAKSLAMKINGLAEIDVFTTIPNRYNSFQMDAPLTEKLGNLNITRIRIPKHRNGFFDQIISFLTYYRNVIRLTKDRSYDLIYASSSRLFTAYLGHKISKRNNTTFYVDVRDIFYDSMKDILKKSPIKMVVLPTLKIVERWTFSNARHINLISKGFETYFKPFTNSELSFFTNGIDDEFLNWNPPELPEKERKTIMYAGNIGEGQGLHKLIPNLAKELDGKYDLIVIGDGGAKHKLIDELKKKKCTNVIIKPPVNRKQLRIEYENADFYLIHLNDYKAFKRVLPSKIFELAALDRPIIAGVSGYPYDFLKENVSNIILFKSCDVTDCIQKLQHYTYRSQKRESFIEKYSRLKINNDMVDSIISYLI